MEMLTNPSLMTISQPSMSYTPGGPGKASSLLDRRSSRTLVPPDTTTTTVAVHTSTPAVLSSDPTLSVSHATAAGTTVRAPRPSSSALLSFVPLTPILASPRLTPDIGSGPGPAALAHLDSELNASNGPTVVLPESITVQSPSFEDGLHVPDVVRVPNTIVARLDAAVSLPPPSWTSTPPTPPLKGVSPSRSDSTSPSRDRKRSCSRSRQGHVRPASVAVFPAYRPPSPPLLYIFESTASSIDAPLPSAARSLSATNTRELFSEDARLVDITRRKTLPRNFGKLPAYMPDAERCRPGSSRVSEHLKRDGGRDEDEDGVLPPSLSRHSELRRGRSSDKSPLGVSVVTREDSVMSARCRAKFTLDDEDASEGENDDDRETAPTEIGGGSVEAASGKVDGEERELHRERERTGMKRYHALMELLTTEVGYLMDLRALVTIYLAHLTSIHTTIPSPILNRPSPSALSIASLSRSRLPSSRSSQMQITLSAGPGPPLSDCPSSYFDKYYEMSVDHDPEKGKPDKEKQARRAIYSDVDLQAVRRNAEELLQLHQRFLSALREKLEPLGYGSAFVDVPIGGEEELTVESGPTHLDTVDEAIDAIAEAFSREASSFKIYESYCPGHNEAATLVRNIQERYPVEWDAFEQRCSLRVAHEFELTVQSMYASSSRGDQLPSTGPIPASTSGFLHRKRRHSTSSVAAPTPQPPFSVVTSSPSHLPVLSSNKSESGSGHKRKASGGSSSAITGGTSQAGRLKFLDYLIKPVQRLCKYPLLLDQLRIKRKQLDAELELGAVENACNAMRAVVAQVDKASERQAHRVKSALIISRLAPSIPSSPTSSEGHEEQCAQLTAEFLRSLGVCLLAGALEVIYPQSGGGLRGKYLAAFLYVGGYLVLAKVPKGGKAYEPRHWFPLSAFEVVDEEEDDPALPYAFHLLSPGSHLHLAAACQLEKTIWMAAIQDARSVYPPEWINEPIPSIPADDRPPMSATEEFAPDWSAALPTIQSMSDLETTPDPNIPALPLPSPRKMAKTVSRADGAAMREYQLSALNRRTSTSSVKAFFAPLSFDSRITRPSSQIRQQVDIGLHEVFSETFVTVRSQAQMRDEEFFQLRRKPGNMSRSNSGLSISGAFTTRRRHDSTIALSSRRKGSLDGVPDIINDLGMGQKPIPLTMSKRSRSAVAKRRGKLPLSVVPSQSSYIDGDAALVQSPEGSLEAPSPLTHSSSTSSSNAGSTLPSPMDLSIPLPMMSCPIPSGIRASEPRRMDYRPKRTRSMVDNVKQFFHTRSMSPSPSSEEPPSIPVVSLDVEADTPPGGLVQWWRRGSLRRRVQSSPEVPTEDSSPSTPAASSEDSHMSSNSNLSADHSTPSSAQSPDPTPSTPPRATPRRVAFSDATPLRRRSLFAFSPRSDFRSSPSTETVLPRSKTLKNIFHFQRSNSFTRTPDSDSQNLDK